MEKITNEDVSSRVATALLDFLERATKKDATSDEVKIIPDVARILLDYPIRSS